jgi:pyrroline-5-carboxylate reductase
VSRVIGADISTNRLNELKDRIGDSFAIATAAQAARAGDIVVVAVKPHVLPAVLDDLHDVLRPGCPLVSVAAGVQIERIENSLPSEWPVIRAMPNLAMLVRESATALSANRFVTQQDMQTVESVFRAVGTVVQVEESQMHAVTGLTGSGPAYVSLVIEGLAAGGVKKGLQPSLARELACQLLYGTAKLLAEKDLHPAVLRDQVTTPGGTTIAGLKELEMHSVRGALLAAVEAASERSEELAES